MFFGACFFLDDWMVKVLGVGTSNPDLGTEPLIP